MIKLPQIVHTPVIALALCGFLTAIANILMTAIAEDLVLYFYGSLFGAALAVYLMRFKNLHWIRALLLVAASTVSWIAAFFGAMYLTDVLNHLDGHNALVGMLAGAIGSAIVALGFSIAYPKFLNVGSILVTLAIGSIAGLALWYELEYSPSSSMSVLWIVWQASVGASLGWNRNVFE